MMALPVLVLGIIALAAVIGGVLAVIAMARRQANVDSPPPSAPTDFVAPVSSGGYAWRRTDESAEEFRERVARERAP
jgi:hypothetical protein